MGRVEARDGAILFAAVRRYRWGEEERGEEVSPNNQHRLVVSLGLGVIAGVVGSITASLLWDAAQKFSWPAILFAVILTAAVAFVVDLLTERPPAE